MSKAALIRPQVLSDNATTIVNGTLRRNILAVLNGPMFTRYEREKAKLKLIMCADTAQLQRYYSGVQAERQKRETAAQWANHEGTYVTGLDAHDFDDDATWAKELDDCDQDLAA